MIGGQAGYNVQVGRTVFGIEGEYGGMNSRGGVTCPTMNFFTCEAEAHSLAMLTGRVGYDVGPRPVLREGRLGGR